MSRKVTSVQEHCLILQSFLAAVAVVVALLAAIISISVWCVCVQSAVEDLNVGGLGDKVN